MNYFFQTVARHISFFLRKGILYPLIIALIISAIYYFISTKKHNTKTAKSTVNLLFIIFFYFSPLQLAVIARLGWEKVNPTEKIFGGWLIENLKYSADLQPIENILLFTPFAISLCIFIITHKDISFKKLILMSTGLSFLMSAIIEFSQLMLCIGTFQISDLVYNTLGGLIGALIVILINKHIKKNIE